MNRQMYNMGGPSLQTGAPDITLTGDMRPTYSAMRKQRMAYGGIAGLDGRKNYGIGSFFQEKIMDPIKNNPVTSAIIGGGLLNEFGVPDVLTKIPGVGQYIDPDFGKNFLGELLGKVIPGPTEFNTVIGDDIPFKDLIGDQSIYGDPSDDTSYGQTSAEKAEQQGAIQSAIAALGSNYLPESSQALLRAAGLLPNQTAERDAAGNVTYEQKRRDLNADLAKALAAGTAAGAYVESQPKDELPADTTGLDIPAIAQAARGTDADAEAAGLRFLPPQVARAANGGRIGYANGMGVDELPYARDIDSTYTASGADFMPAPPEEPYRENMTDQIIDAMGKDFDYLVKIKLRENLKQGETNEDAIALAEQEAANIVRQKYTTGGLNMAQGGRIGYDMGGGVMMASHEGNTQLLEQLYNDFLDLGYSPADAARKAQEEFDRMSNTQQTNRVMAQEGGLMDLGGMEKDYREEGGFVPIGGKEKADDVPARLSKNEFVFTADAVRNAGGGDIDEGAAIMERMMKNLEQGGQVSEESQGLEGAREMFETSQRLEKRII